ncbi:MAG: hypothetical protein GXO00_00935 [Candidatus Diapherotrites archaeon]|nr:hypothetical protein [Candidatus Diapherotrites archaeon]
MYLERFRWGEWTDGEELFSALERGFLQAAYEYLCLTGDLHGLRRTILRVLSLPLDKNVRKRLLWLLRSARKLVFLDRGDGWAMAMVGGRVVGWVRVRSGSCRKTLRKF